MAAIGNLSSPFSVVRPLSSASSPPFRCSGQRNGAKTRPPASPRWRPCAFRDAIQHRLQYVRRCATLGGSRGRDIFFEWKDISVSRTIARFGATSYQISNISLVRLRYEKKFNPIAVVLFLIGAAILTVAIGRPEDLPPGSDRAIALVGAALVALAVIVQVFWPKKEFTFSLKTSSGDAESLVTQDRQFAEDLKRALEDAFATRP
jgi:hypothetical protein